MGRFARRFAFASFLFAAACSSPAIAAPGAQIALGIAPMKVRAPYDVQILRDDGSPLRTYGLRDRFYVPGEAGERYIIRVTNPTDRRIEVVVSVDGLDVIDGENGDLRKRGYVVPPYGETRIEGFRTSEDDVATFRFSSVGGSYAGQKGKARNVGVIAVAVFEERAPEPPPMIIGEAMRSAPSPRKSAAPAAAAHAAGSAADGGRDYDAAPRQERLGLGTEFGEQRDSAVSFTRFVRASGRPIAVAELRYNDAAGLIALGIPVQEMPDEDEIYTRETANPFPGDRFAKPVR